MPIKSLIMLIINEIRNDFVKSVYDKYIADLIRVMAMNKKIDDNGNSWSEIYETVIGVNKVEHTPAQDVIADIMTRHGIKFADEAEARRILGDKADEFIQPHC